MVETTPSSFLDQSLAASDLGNFLNQWRERFLIYILRGAAVIGIFVLAASASADIRKGDWLNVAVTAAAYGVLLAINFIRLPYRIRARIVIFLLFALAINSLLTSGIRGEGRMFWIIYIMLNLMLIGIRAAQNAIGITILSISTVAWAVVTQRFTLTEPYNQLDVSSWVVGSISMLLIVFLLMLGVIGLQREFIAAQKREKVAKDDMLKDREQLETRVSERTRELSLAADVGRSVSQLHDLDALLPKAVELIRSQFSLYYAQIYLMDATGRMLTLRAGTGGVGAELLRRGHRLPVGPGSINGVAAAERKTMIVVDTSTNPVFRPNPLLPETRSELAVPLLVGDRVVGVLDLQSRHPGALSDENLSVFEALAGQLAIALENAALFAQTEQARQEVEEQARRLTQAGWHEFLNAVERGERIGYQYDQDSLSPYNDPLPQVQSDLLSTNTVKSPILVTGAAVGSIQIERGSDQPWQEEELELVSAVVGQASRQLDNLRLLSQAESYRTEAEEAARRLTREGWVEYLHTRSEVNSYVYNQNEVKPLEPGGPDLQPGIQPAGVVQPLRVGEEIVGELAFDGVEQLDAATNELVTNVAGLLSGHIEGLRLTEQTQKALIETEGLYAASAELNTARTYEDILSVLRRHTLIGEGAHVVMLNLFNRPGSQNDMPEWLDVVAVWNELSLDGTMGRSSMASYPSALATLDPNYPTLIENVEKDTRLDEAARMLYLQQLKSQKFIIVPLVAGGQWIGLISAGFAQSGEFPPEEVRRTMALAGQAAVAINNLRLLDGTQALAQREKNLRQITAMVRGSTNANTILRNATRELGVVLGRKVKVQLGETK